MNSKCFKLQIKLVLIFFFMMISCHQNLNTSDYRFDDLEVYESVQPPESKIEFNTEEYDRIYENEFLSPFNNPLSTFSIDVDNAAYSNVRRFINQNQLPPKDAVRVEELINYFNYKYSQPKDEHPFSFTTEVSNAPWNINNKLVHIGIKGKQLDYDNLKNSNLVFLIDASGSMSSPNKLPLLRKGLKLLLNELGEEDTISIVAYAGAAGIVLPSTKASNANTILEALDKIEAGGSTAGGEGIELAYKLASENFISNGNNRVILATDGDFNVGISSSSDLVRFIETKQKSNIYLTICGFGMGNYKDGRMEQISNAGNGNYFYIDNIMEAQKVFATEMRANMFTIAKDVKIQIEFNPTKVKAYRLIGYENRMMKSEDFNNDLKDAGELGAGHTVTALYEIIPTTAKTTISQPDVLKYQTSTTTNKANSNELMTIKFRYKKPTENNSNLITTYVLDKKIPLENTSENFKFSSSVAAFGMLLRNSKYKANASFEMAKELAVTAKGEDKNGYRSEFINLIEKASLLQ